MGDSTDWNDISKQLKERFNCFTIDLPGHGKNKISYVKKEDYYTEITSRLELFAPFLGHGYSMGGRILLDLRNKYSHLFSHLILESVNPGLDSKEERDHRLSSDQKLLLNTEKDLNKLAFLDKWYDSPLWGNLKKHKHYSELINKKLLKTDWTLWQKSLNLFSIGLQTSYWKMLKTEKNLTLLSGSRDKKYTLINKKLYSHNKKINLIIILDSGHNIHYESPEKVIHTYFAN